MKRSYTCDQIRHMPDEPGLYYVWQGDDLLYIGMTTNFRQRWASHHRLPEYRNLEGVTIEIAPMPGTSAEQLKVLERNEIAERKPRDNDTRTTGSPPIQWRAPAGCREWLEAQPGGISPTLEMLVRGAMGRRRTHDELEREIIRLEAQIELLTRLVQSNTTKPAPVEAPATDDDDWGDSWGNKED